MRDALALARLAHREPGVAGSERGRRRLQALRDTLSAVRATIVGGDPHYKGPGAESQGAALVQAFVEAAAASENHGRVDETGPSRELPSVFKA
jgi:hypothetical protein